MKNPKLVNQMPCREKIGFPVILNTGRSISWLQERMFSKLYSPNLLSNNSALKNLLFVGEKGAIWVELSIKGFLNLKINKDKSIFIPEKIKQKLEI